MFTALQEVVYILLCSYWLYTRQRRVQYLHQRCVHVERAHYWMHHCFIWEYSSSSVHRNQLTEKQNWETLFFFSTECPVYRLSSLQKIRRALEGSMKDPPSAKALLSHQPRSHRHSPATCGKRPSEWNQAKHRNSTEPHFLLHGITALICFWHWSVVGV